MSVAIEDDMFAEVAKGGRFVNGETVLTVTVDRVQSRLNVAARTALRNPQYVRIFAKRSGAIRLVASDGSGENDIRSHPDGAFGRLHLFAEKNGFTCRRYGVRLVDGALEFQLERTPKEVDD